MYDIYVSKFGEEIFSTNDSILYCQMYNIKVAAEKKMNVNQHVTRDIRGLENK